MEQIPDKSSIFFGINGIGKTVLLKKLSSRVENSEIISTENHNLSLFRKVKDELYLINMEPSQLLESLLELTGFSNKLNYTISSLSGGEKLILQLLLAIKVGKDTLFFDDNLEMINSRLKESIYRELINNKITIFITDVKLPTYYSIFDYYYIINSFNNVKPLDKKNLLTILGGEEIYIENCFE